MAIVLGLVQGATEFLPVSSSGHVMAIALFAALPRMSLSFVVLLHAGTLLATLAVLGRDVVWLLASWTRGLVHPAALWASDAGRMGRALIASLIPTAAAGLWVERRVHDWGQVPWVLGVCFLGSALAALSTRKTGGPQEVPGIGAALVIGLTQGLATLPGLSRSGLTIACAMALGMSGPAAFRYSFLLSIPVLVGAVGLEAVQEGGMRTLGADAWVGAAVACASGFVALRVLRTLVGRGQFWLFALYLAPLGLGLLLLDAARVL